MAKPPTISALYVSELMDASQTRDDGLRDIFQVGARNMPKTTTHSRRRRNLNQFPPNGGNGSATHGRASDELIAIICAVWYGFRLLGASPGSPAASA